jgi:glycerol dehydrogenase
MAAFTHESQMEENEMIRTTIFPGRYVQGYEATKRLGAELPRYGQKALVVADPFVAEHLLPDFRESLEASIEIVVDAFGGESSDEEIERLTRIGGRNSCDLVVGIGGGKALDTAKAVAHELDSPVAIVPTIASSDAPCSALSVIYTPEGEFKRYLVLPRNPDLVLVDTKIIAQAPVRFLVAGMGDALATWFEAESARKKFAGNMTGDVGSMTAYALSRLCYDTLQEYGALAKRACEVQVVTPALERIVEANTLLSGLGFESGGLAAAHAIHNGLTVLEETHGDFHGEKVAFGTLASLFLSDQGADLIDEVYSFCEEIGLPTTLEEIGLGDVSDADLTRVAEAACAEGETIHNEPRPVTPDKVFAALKAADAEGRERKWI